MNRLDEWLEVLQKLAEAQRLVDTAARLLRQRELTALAVGLLEWALLARNGVRATELGRRALLSNPPQ